MPVFFLNSGSRYSNRPESCVDVVEATTINLSCASAGVAAMTAPSARATSAWRLNMNSSTFVFLDQQLSSDEFLRFFRARIGEKFPRRTLFDQPAAVQQHDVASEPLCLAEIVRRHHHLDAACSDGAHDVLDCLCRRGIEVLRRLVEKQQRRTARQCAGERQPLLFAAREPARGAPRGALPPAHYHHLGGDG